MFANRKLILIIILLITLSVTAYVIVVVIPSRLAERSYEGAKQIGRDISDAFQFTPEITVNNIVVLQQQTPILELATLSQKFQHQYEWTNTWLGSTKKINIRGSFEAKAGFDLNKKFSIEINDEKALVTLPRPELLSVESLSDVKFEDENGVWNWVDMEDRTKAINAFTTDARKYAIQAQFVNEAQQSMEKKLTEILKLHGKEVEIRYSEAQRIPVK
ncbi:MAG: hypothetical protein C0490_08025 [Marivirga sp.]|nr:hypothetical protein [Marivirga sp.]